MLEGSVPSTSPTSPRSTASPSTTTGALREHTVHMYAGIPTALTPDSVRHSTTSALILLSTSSATSRDASSVTRTPATFLGVIPLRSISSDISGPPPWTSTTRHPPATNSATSPARRRRSSLPRMALPPNFRRYVPILSARVLGVDAHVVVGEVAPPCGGRL